MDMARENHQSRHHSPHDPASTDESEPAQRTRYSYPPIPHRRNSQQHNPERSNQGSDAETLRSSYMKTSVSSQESGSSATSGCNERKQQDPWPDYAHGQILEEPSKVHRSWCSSTHQSQPPYPAPHRKLVEDNSAVYQYIEQQRTLEEQVDKEDPDHAIWILVR